MKSLFEVPPREAGMFNNQGLLLTHPFPLPPTRRKRKGKGRTWIRKVREL